MAKFYDSRKFGKQHTHKFNAQLLQAQFSGAITNNNNERSCD